MSKSTFIIGVIIAVLVHSLLFLDFDKNTLKAEEVEPKKVARILIPPLPKPPERTPPDPGKPLSLPSRPPKESFDQVVTDSTQGDIPDSLGDYAADGDEGLPSLRLIWDSPEHLIQVSKALNLRVIPVNNSNKPIGELCFERNILVNRFSGELSGYSNRVRTISSHFFGINVLNQCQENVQCFWIIVPTDIDYQWVSIQKQVLRSKGLNSSQVSYMEAQIVNNENGYELLITSIART